MYELTPQEYDALRSQIGILKRGEHSKYAPMAFTEQGVATNLMIPPIANIDR